MFRMYDLSRQRALCWANTGKHLYLGIEDSISDFSWSDWQTAWQNYVTRSLPEMNHTIAQDTVYSPGACPKPSRPVLYFLFFFLPWGPRLGNAKHSILEDFFVVAFSSSYWLLLCRDIFAPFPRHGVFRAICLHSLSHFYAFLQARLCPQGKHWRLTPSPLGGYVLPCCSFFGNLFCDRDYVDCAKKISLLAFYWVWASRQRYFGCRKHVSEHLYLAESISSRRGYDDPIISVQSAGCFFMNLSQ